MVHWKWSLPSKDTTIFSIGEKGCSIEDKTIEIILPDPFCTVETCSICKNNLYGTNIDVYPLIDLSISNLIIDFQNSYVIMGSLNLFGWVVLKSNISLSEK